MGIYGAGLALFVSNHLINCINNVNIKTSPVTKYLAKYSEPETDLIDLKTIQHQYHHVAIIPAYNEATDFLEKLLTYTINKTSILLILIINVPNTASLEPHIQDAKITSQLLLKQLQQSKALLWQSKNEQLQLHKYSTNIHYLLVDRCSSGQEIPTNQGVGLARKIGADIACKLIDAGIIKSHWIHSSDADIILPANYWNQNFSTHNAAVTYPFQHNPSEKSYQLAMALYELSLHWYVLGLKWAKSPYAHHSIGSTLAINYESYAKVRGFPKRSAGEDFYILNKLRKIGGIYQPATPIIEIQGRPSARVPFGTGPALIKIMGYNNPVNDFVFYHPKIFCLLKNWLALLPTLAANPNYKLSNITKKIIGNNHDYCSTDQIHKVLLDLKIEQALIHAHEHSRTEQAFLNHMHIWFDALRTLKFIHGIRNNALPSLPIQTAVQNAKFFDINSIQNQNWITLMSIKLLRKIF